MSSLRISFKRATIYEAIIRKYQKQTIIKKVFFVHSIKMSNSLKDLGLSSEELKAIAEIRGIKGYESISEGELLSANTPSKKNKKKAKTAKKGKKQKQIFLKQE